ncbi:hypothetical protein ERJ75_001451100 [Trypanosoma vivax]|uniref:Uncharacterized protein n=1 Tax=Trypanosoma vivax (strain Y486) TaxID=1055687 RepID=G0TW58_TRYVY|nr:hypothetical protein TRVL_00284 [Trypanosoma vivax]KAH8607020.1 hypothetical protein ERJ75_001451100 [Trypanosoma vivax]CCC48174.1 conserved hypothetical protein [Trypanosoma vivax Y486]
MFSQRWGPLLLSPKLSFVVRNVAVEQQRAELQEVVHYHKVAVTHGTEQDVGDNKVSNNKNYGSYSTYDPVASVYFPTFQVALLPPTNGVHRATLRASLATDVVDDFRRHVVQAWQGAAARQAILIGCRSVPYMERQLEMDNLYSFLVIDRILSNLLDAAEMLVPKYGTRVHFLRSDAFFCVQQLLPSEVADVCVAPMPVPFVSERSSHQRLVTRDFLCAVHHVLRLRESPSDQRGFVTFTDFVPLGEFMMEQLEESRLIVPWTRKNPSETYGRWLPGEHKHICEFPRQRSSGGIVAIAASKSGGTSSQALAVIQQLEYKRRYHRALLSPTEG